MEQLPLKVTSLYGNALIISNVKLCHFRQKIAFCEVFCNCIVCIEITLSPSHTFHSCMPSGSILRFHRFACFPWSQHKRICSQGAKCLTLGGDTLRNLIAQGSKWDIIQVISLCKNGEKIWSSIHLHISKFTVLLPDRDGTNCGPFKTLVFVGHWFQFIFLLCKAVQRETVIQTIFRDVKKKALFVPLSTYTYRIQFNYATYAS